MFSACAFGVAGPFFRHDECIGKALGIPRFTNVCDSFDIDVSAGWKQKRELARIHSRLDGAAKLSTSRGGWLALLVSTLAFRLFPKWLHQNGRGPEWEFNRRTGIIKVWQYSRKRPFLPRKPPVVIEKPFYEFDAWCCARADRFGTLFDLVLSHRYSKLDVTVGDILGAHGSATMCYAYWDFIQNYMDITKPLPEMPLLEKYRPLDPVTVEHDRQTGRPPRYWRDMDDQTFKKKVDRMFTDVTIINTAQRPNLMEEKLRYAS